jgi:hypothetical protein
MTPVLSFNQSSLVTTSQLRLPNHAGDAYMQIAEAFRDLPPGGTLSVEGYRRRVPGSLCHQPGEAVWAFVKHNEDRLSVLSWDEPVTLRKHAIPRGWTLGECFRRLFGGVVVISLREAAARREAMEQWLASGDVEADFLQVDRVGWDSLLPPDYYRVDAYGRDDYKEDRRFLAGLVGARRSHQKAVLRAGESGWKSVMILEDDTEFWTGAAGVLERIHNELPGDWQILTLSYGSERTEWHSPSLLRLHGGWLAGAYAVRDTAYDTLTSWWERCGTEVDNWSLCFEETGLRGYASFPRLGWETGVPSTIGRPERWGM